MLRQTFPLLACALMICAMNAPAATPAPTESPVQTAAQRSGETARYTAAGAAATRGLNLCSGRWSGGLTDEIIERDLNGRDPAMGALPAFPATIDEVRRTVSLQYDNAMPPRHVVWRPVLGCVQLPPGSALDGARLLPRVDEGLRAPDLDREPWPMGDANATSTLPTAQQAGIDSLLDAAFDERSYGGTTWGVVILVDGRIVGERYGRGFDLHKGSQTHSAAKSFAASLLGVASGAGILKLQDPAPIAAWRKPGDPRGAITSEHLLRMSSGLYTQGRGSPLQKIYSQGGTVADLAATNILDTMPGSTFVYSPPDTMLAMRALREAMGDDRRFLAFPYREFFWRIGMTRTTTNTDWNGDFLMSGQTWSTARDFARFGLLYLNDGVWLGERILPAGWVQYVTTKGPAQPASAPFYGAQFWLHGGMAGLPEDAFTPSGGQGHYAMVIPSRKVVIVRRGFDAGAGFDISRFSADVLKAIGRP
jgi:CubicO group peptidase (beta-lactamase class C family)